MPLNTGADNAPAKFPDPEYLTLGKFDRGVITLIDKSHLPKNAAEDMTNLWLVEDGEPSPRPGIAWYGQPMPNGLPIQGFDYFDFVGAIHIVAVAGGVVYRSIDDGVTWSACSGATLNTTAVVNMEQYNSFLYITDALDQIVRYDGTTTLQTYTSLSTPVAPTIVETGMTGSTYTFYYEISAVSEIGFTAASPAGSIQTSQPRANWTTGTIYNTLTLPSPVATQTRFDIYYSVDNLNFYYLDSVPTSVGSPTLTYVDDGTAFEVVSTIAPTNNTTQGPTVSILKSISGTASGRMFGVGDPNNRNRIWFTSGAQPLGSFSSGYDGGYLDWQLGGKYLPIQVADYRDGKGVPMATVFCNAADGLGCVIQMSLNPLSIGSSGLSVTIPSAYKLPGSRGTPAPRSVVNVLDDYFFYNTQAIYQLGSNPQLLQILSTQELSANIRPTVQTILNSAAPGICAAYHYDRVYFSFPYNSATNNYTAIFDTERRAWLPTAYDKGFSQFLHYTDTNGFLHLLAVKPGDTQLTELGSLFGSDIIQGDYGLPFSTNLLTGLYQTEKDRFGFEYTQEMEFEFSNPQGLITVELLGIEHSQGFGSQKVVPFNPNVSVTTAGWDTFAWDVDVWDDTSVLPTVVSESSAKRYAVVNRELNAVQWHIYTSALVSAYILRTLQTWGTNSEDAHPSNWLLDAVQ